MQLGGEEIADGFGHGIGSGDGEAGLGGIAEEKVIEFALHGVVLIAHGVGDAAVHPGGEIGIQELGLIGGGKV